MALLHTDGPWYSEGDVRYITLDLGGSRPVMWHHKFKFKHTLLSLQTVEAAWFISYGMNRVYTANQIFNPEHDLHNIHVHVPDVWRFTHGKNLEINSNHRGQESVAEA